MQRINLSVDLETNEILTKEIDKAIEAAVKSKTREYFHESLETELKRLTDKTLENWTYRGWSSNPNRLEKAVRDQIDTQISKEIGRIEISSADIEKAISDKMKKIDEQIAYYVAKRVERTSFEDYISDLVEKEVHRALPEKLLQILLLRATEKEG